MSLMMTFVLFRGETYEKQSNNSMVRRIADI